MIHIFIFNTYFVNKMHRKRLFFKKVLHILAAEIIYFTNHYCKPKTCSMKKLSVFLAGLLLTGITLVQAQTVRITGTVTSSEDGMPMPGVSVVVMGTTIGATTNADGKYELAVPASAQTLTFSFVGYETQDVAVAGRSVIDVVMKPESKQIEEVVVVAPYGTFKKESFTGSASTVKTEKLKEIQTSNITKALEGLSSGIQVTSGLGQPGTTATIRIRGIG